MKGQKGLKDIFINYASSSMQMPRQYYVGNDRTEILTNELLKKLKKKKDKQKLNKLCDTIHDTESIYSEEAFVCGFALASQLMAEAFNIDFKF